MLIEPALDAFSVVGLPVLRGGQPKVEEGKQSARAEVSRPGSHLGDHGVAHQLKRKRANEVLRRLDQWHRRVDQCGDGLSTGRMVVTDANAASTMADVARRARIAHSCNPVAAQRKPTEA